MPEYDGAQFTPPAPVAQVIMRSPKTDDSVPNVPMLIDTGADVTLLPRDSLSELLTSADSGDEYELEGFDGTRSLAPSVLLELRFLGRIFRGRSWLSMVRTASWDTTCLTRSHCRWTGPIRPGKSGNSDRFRTTPELIFALRLH